MSFSIGDMIGACKFASSLTIEAFSLVLPQSAIDDVIALEGLRHQRERRLTASLTLWIVIALHLDMFVNVRQRGAHVLGHLPSYAPPTPLRVLSDGSVLARIVPADFAHRKAGEQLLVRVISHTISDEALPGYGEQHRVVTTLLNPSVAPAHEVACG